tara:strand:+ start:514 stop:1518 length:1005 start_codon:yes stop_codon:yes gene_type:complete
MALRLRRGTDAQRLTLDGAALPVPAEGEIIYTTDTKKLYVGDGSTTGGIAVDVANSDLNINNLSDVDTTSAGHVPSDGEALVWDQGMTHWMPGDATILSDKSINALQDVDTISNTPTVGQVLKYDGAGWVNGTDVSGGLIPSATYPINITGDVQGSVFADDSSLVIDGLTGNITTPTITTNSIATNAFYTDSGLEIFGEGFNIVAYNGTADSMTSKSPGDTIGYMSFATTYDSSGNNKLAVGHAATLDATADLATAAPRSNLKWVIGNNSATTNIVATLDYIGNFSANVITPGTYADSTARDTAITTPTSGMMVFVTDVAKFQGYDGSAWVNLN